LGAEAERTRVRPDDVLLTITGSKIGRAALVKETDAGAYVSQHVAILRVLPGLDPDVLTAFLVCDRGGQRLIARAQYGQTKPGLNLAQIRAFPVPIPPEELQARVRAVRLEIRQLHRRLEEGLRSTDGLIRSLTYGAFHWSHGSTTPRPAGAGDSEAE
jgi:type I restriction enzyme S subunit